MDKFYFASSDGSVRDSEGELYHFGWKKKDAKYIKREWKNGRWVYTYKDDAKNDNSRPSGSDDNVGGKFSKAVDNAKAILGKYVDTTRDKRAAAKAERKQDWEESKVRGTKKAKEEATKNDGAFVVGGKGGMRERGDTGFVDSDRFFSGKRTIVVGNTEINTITRGKLDRFIDTAKEYVKDRLGYDERDAAKAAITKHEVAKKAEEKFKTEADVTKAFMGTADPRTGEKTYTESQKKELEKMERTERMMREHTDKTGKAASEAAEAYIDTPLAKIEKARKVGEEWLDKLFKRKR